MNQCSDWADNCPLGICDSCRLVESCLFGFCGEGSISVCGQDRNDCDRCRADELRIWQAQERAQRLQPLLRPVAEVCRRLLLTHRDWDVQEMLHLDYVSFEVTLRRGKDPVLVECRWPEYLEYDGPEWVYMTVVPMPGTQNLSGIEGEDVPVFVGLWPDVPGTEMDQFVKELEDYVTAQK